MKARAVLKRAMDLSFALAALGVFLPLFLCIVLLIRVFMGSPIFFRQQRPGLNGHPFVIYKFRTMSELKDGDGRPLPDGVRLTKIGKFLRKTSLDEVPQLINVLRGDMSLIGPRPLLMEYLPLYSKDQMRRHLVRPGITGWAQVNGRNTISWQDRFKLDNWYVDNVSLILDLKIMLMTVFKVLRRDGIDAPNTDTMDKFTGN